KNLWADGKLDEVVEFLKARYSAEEWGEMITANVKPLLDDYFASVLGKPRDPCPAGRWASTGSG
ncbi:MAG TPA: hypothetical protein DEQ86_02680, partial [Candidatus Jacksonbacteria bacterium]|nr:hypothetical protein [Candidatus Jacksonbacteria bacterium]